MCAYHPCLQAQDRAYRIGQRHDVNVYRLVSSNTIEENMYLRQVSQAPRKPKNKTHRGLRAGMDRGTLPPRIPRTKHTRRSALTPLSSDPPRAAPEAPKSRGARADDSDCFRPCLVSAADL